jgi:hypothetical protein
MIRIQYKCNFESEIVLNSDSATEGYSTPLDYIPGAKFLGIVAGSLYSSSASKPLDLFHNGNVVFGDAHIAIANKRTLQVPLSWYYPKGNLFTKDGDLHHKQNRDSVYKQARKGYFTEDKIVQFDVNLAIKSAYNRETKTSDDGKMFAYYSYPSGTEWLFSITYKDSATINLVEKELLGLKRIGKSTSAEYGLVTISKDRILEIQEPKVYTDHICIYAESNLCFHDEYGLNTLTPTVKDFNIPEGEIIWNDSQIRTRTLQTWNGKRNTRDADRNIIVKGSVFVVKLFKPTTLNSDLNYVGAYVSEGFGKVLYAPDFLDLAAPVLKSTPLINVQNKSCVDSTNEDELCFTLIKQMNLAVDKENEIDVLVNEFTTKYSNWDEMNSQWGQVRIYAKHTKDWSSLNKFLFDGTDGFFYHGIKKELWERQGKRDVLKESLESIDNEESKINFLLKLSSKMAKDKRNEK